MPKPDTQGKNSQKQRFSKVSSILNLLYEMMMELTFENFASNIPSSHAHSEQLQMHTHTHTHMQLSDTAVRARRAIAALRDAQV